MVKKRITLAATALAIALMITGCGTSLYESHKGEYTPVTAVSAAEFEMLTSLSSKATAVSNISEDEKYEGLYIYKDGSTKYVLFDTTSIVVAVGPTEFDFQGNESEETLEAHSIENVWMKGENGDFKYKTSTAGGMYKIMADVSAQYALTPTQYCTLHGIMATVSNGKVEYSIFAGSVGDELTSSQRKTVEHIVKSFRLKKDVEQEEPDKEAEHAQDEKEQSNTETTPNVEEQTVENDPEEVSVDSGSTEEGTDIDDTADNSKEDVEKTEDTPEEEAEEAIDAEDEPATIEEIDGDEAGIEEEEEEKAPAETPVEAPVEEPVETHEETPAAKPANYKVNPKQSTAFTPLALDEWGVASVIKKDGTLDYSAVLVNNIYAGEEAEKLIKDNNGRKKTPKEGTKFVVVEYTTDVSNADAYLDLRFCGVDGERLVLRGVSYTQRTYDMLESETKDTTSHNMTTYATRYAYYEVPTGCKEYLLSFGYRIPNYQDQLETANYLVKVK